MKQVALIIVWIMVFLVAMQLFNTYEYYSGSGYFRSGDFETMTQTAVMQIALLGTVLSFLLYRIHKSKK